MILDLFKRLAVHFFVGANVMAAILLLSCGLSSTLSPAEHPRLALFCLGFPLLLVVNVAFVFFWLIFQAKKVWIALAGLLCSGSYISSYCPLNIPSKAPEGALKLLTYNTKSFGNSKIDENGHNAVLDYLLQSGADIICLQEALPGYDLKIKDIDKQLSENGYYGIDFDKADSDGELRGDQRIYSKLPILSAESVVGASAGNGVLAARLLYDNDTILLLNNHLESYRLTMEDKQHYKEILKEPEGEKTEENSKALLNKMTNVSKLRGPQVDSVLQYIKASGAEAVISCGDFNDSPVSYPCHKLSECLKDAYKESGNGLGFSYVDKGFYFRIDHIFVSDYWQTYDTHIDKTITASDHYPMITYLRKCKK